MLVSASSGYGKSMVISSFLKNQPEQYAWLSLSSKENDFQQFIKYFMTAIEGSITGFGKEIHELLGVPNPPSPEEIAELIVNELADLKAPFFLAIDDYHLIKNESIHLFVSKLLEYPQSFFRLLLSTRRDPELPLPNWRSSNKIIEIRSSDLRFNRSEIAEFYIKAVNYQPEAQILTSIEKSTQGWVSGLRMLILSLENTKEIKILISPISLILDGILPTDGNFLPNTLV